MLARSRYSLNCHGGAKQNITTQNWVVVSLGHNCSRRWVSFLDRKQRWRSYLVVLERGTNTTRLRCTMQDCHYSKTGAWAWHNIAEQTTSL